jgi:hypothetical protein
LVYKDFVLRNYQLRTTAKVDKHAEPSPQVVQSEEIPVRHEGDATIRVLVGEGSSVQLGTPGLILDIELPTRGEVTTLVPQACNWIFYGLNLPNLTAD